MNETLEYESLSEYETSDEESKKKINHKITKNENKKENIIVKAVENQNIIPGKIIISKKTLLLLRR